MSLDFNDAPTWGQQERLDLFQLKIALTANCEAVCYHLFPSGKVKGKEFLVGDISGTPGKSLSINLKSGVWADFASDQKGDLVELWMKSRRLDFVQACKEAQDFLGTGPRPSRAPRAKDAPTTIGLVENTWYYYTPDGKKLLAVVYRHKTADGGKEFRPYDPNARKDAFPDPRPLYNLPGIVKAQEVILVEGEKCAEALIKLGFCATTAMGGSNAPAQKTDWSPLNGKNVLIWPDNDEPGFKYAGAAAEAIRTAGGAPRILEIPGGKPLKWDAADAVNEGENIGALLGASKPALHPRIETVDTWGNLTNYMVEPPQINWLVESVFQLAKPGLLAASGDTGKGFLTLDLALKVAGGEEDNGILYPVSAFGNPLAPSAYGKAIILTAEDDRDDVCRRLAALDPTMEKRQRAYHNLSVVPLPNAGGPFPLVYQGKKGPAVSPEGEALMSYLVGKQDLKLVVIDPLASFVHIDINKDPAAGAFLCAYLAQLATQTGACVLVPHHLNKAGKEAISTPEQARTAIRGTTALVDGVRSVYALWQPESKVTAAVCKKMKAAYMPNRVFMGAIVKSNGPTDRRIHTWCRNDFGLLRVVNDIIDRDTMSNNDLLILLESVIRDAAEKGRPFTKSGKSGLHERREELPEELRLPRRTLYHIHQTLLDEGRIRTCNYRGSVAKFLDVPGGPFDRGESTIAQGYGEV